MGIGSRNGDGINCFSRGARSAITIEIDGDACRHLERRAHALRSKSKLYYNVSCGRFPDIFHDADIYTWWQDVPGGLRNDEILSHLKRLQALGHVRQTAEAVLLVDPWVLFDRN